MSTEYIINELQFGLQTNAQIRQNAVVEICDKSLHRKDKYPSDYGLISRYLGATQVYRCLTCGLSAKSCTGHFGYIELNTWIYHPTFIGRVIEILHQICYFCGSILETNDSNSSNSSSSESHPFPVCSKCHQPNPLSYGKDYGLRIQPVWHPKTKFPEKWAYEKAHQLCTPYMAYELFVGLSPQALKHLNYHSPHITHPKSYLLNCISVASLASRAILTRGRGSSTSSRSLDDLTSIYKLILKNTLELKKNQELVELRNRTTDIAQIRKLKLDKRRIDRAKYACHKLPDDIQVQVALLFDKDIRTMTNKSRKLLSTELQSMKPTLDVKTIPIHGPSKSRQALANYTSIYDQIVGNDKKRALIRGHLMGKRVEYTARTVISPDPNLAINEVGIPEFVAKDQTFKECVTIHNIEWLRSLVLNGSNTYPGARAILKKEIDDNGNNSEQIQTNKKKRNSPDLQNFDNHGVLRKKFGLSEMTKSERARITLRIGDLVERHMITGDIVLMNRQPSLHRASIMAHIVRVTKNKTFTINPVVCAPYNADFDGDEKNMHFLQTQSARADAMSLLLVDHHICSTQTSSLMVKPLQDLIDVVFRLSSPETFMSKEFFMDMLCTLPIEGLKRCEIHIPEPAIQIKKSGQWIPLFTGAQLLSSLFPKEIDVEKPISGILICRDTWNDPILDGTELHIQKGRLHCGFVTKKNLNYITTVLDKDFGSSFVPGTRLSRAGIFLTQLSRLTYQYCTRLPSSIGLADVLILDKALKQKLLHLTTSSMETLSKHAPNLTEHELTQLVQKIIKMVGDLLVKHQNPNVSKMTNILRAAISGARGSITNMVQIMGCLGQQHIGGQRVPIIEEEMRTLSFFPPNTNKADLIARGLIIFCSFCTGLRPSEFVMHMMAAREGIISTAIKTSQSGYCNRKLITVLKAWIAINGQVRLNNWILGLVYFGDGLDAQKLCNETCAELKWSQHRLDEMMETRQVPENVRIWLRTTHSNLGQLIAQGIFWKTNTPSVALYYVLQRHLKRAYLYWEDFCMDSDLEDSDRVDPWTQLNLIHKEMERMTSKTQIRLQQWTDYLALSQELHYVSRLPDCSRYKHIWTKVVIWEYIEDQCIRQVARTICPVGEQIGNVGASSIGELTTQMTLNTFHHAGDVDTLGSGGLHRLTENLNVTPTDKMQHTSMILALKSDSNSYLRLQCVRMSDVLSSVQLEAYETHQTEDISFIEIHKHRAQLFGKFSHFYKPWIRPGVSVSKRTRLPIYSQIFRIVLDKQKCLDSQTEITDVAKCVSQYFIKSLSKSASHVYTIYSEPWMTRWILRVQMITNAHTEFIFLSNLISPTSSFHTLHVSGLSQIQSMVPTSYSKFNWNPQEAQLETQDIKSIVSVGTKLQSALNYTDIINPLQSWSNSIQEMGSIFGVMAAQQSLFNETQAVLQSGGSYISPRHIYLMAQTMTHCGFPCPVSRYGLAKMKAGPLLRMSFEEGRSVTEQSTRHCVSDPCTDIAACVILGKPALIGSGSVEIVEKEEEVEDKKKATDLTWTRHDIYRPLTIEQRLEELKEYQKFLSSQKSREEHRKKITQTVQEFLFGFDDDTESKDREDEDDFEVPTSPCPCPYSPQSQEDEDDDDDLEDEDDTKEEPEFEDDLDDDDSDCSYDPSGMSMDSAI